MCSNPRTKMGLQKTIKTGKKVTNHRRLSYKLETWWILIGNNLNAVKVTCASSVPMFS